jgi:hypothetical protein
MSRLRALARHEHDDASIGDEAADEIERLRLAAENDAKRLAWHDETLAERDEKIDILRQQVTQRGARMQIMRKWLMEWAGLKRLTDAYPEAADWFDADGVPK